ncbi:MAG: hypothetical protein ACT4P1_04515 [Sporichthyaceae bacterium]
MTRTRLAAAAVLSLALLAPVAAASSAAAAPKACGESVQVKDHKANKAKAKKKGHNKVTFVHGGKVMAVEATAGTLTFVVRGGQNKALRGCTLTVVVTESTKINRDDAPVVLGAITPTDKVNVKGTTSRDATTGEVTYTATRISADAPEVEAAG